MLAQSIKSTFWTAALLAVFTADPLCHLAFLTLSITSIIREFVG